MGFLTTANDVGRPSYRVPFVRMAFQESYQRLTNNATQDYAPTLLSRIIQPLRRIERARAHWKVRLVSKLMWSLSSTF